MSKLNKHEREMVEDERRIKENFIHVVADLDSEVAVNTLDLVVFRLKSMVDVGNATISTDLIKALIEEIDELTSDPDVLEEIEEDDSDDEDESDSLILLTDFLPKEDDNY